MNIEHKLSIKASASSIYNALSTEKGISGWWAKKAEVATEVGGTSLLSFNKQGTIVEMSFQTILLEPNKKVVWKCIENANPAWLNTEIISEITAHGDVCEVNFTHAGFDSKWKDQEAFTMTKATWSHFMDSLRSFCEKGEGQAW